MRGGVLGETETRADRRARMRLRKVAGEWFPTIPVDVLDQIVAAASASLGIASMQRLSAV